MLSYLPEVFRAPKLSIALRSPLHLAQCAVRQEYIQKHQLSLDCFGSAAERHLARGQLLARQLLTSTGRQGGLYVARLRVDSVHADRTLTCSNWTGVLRERRDLAREQEIFRTNWLV